MTKQEIFDKAVRGLASQGFRRSADWYGRCLYNGPEGRHCAVGWLVTDLNLDGFNGVSVYDLVCDLPAFASRFEGLAGFLASLQSAHDIAYKEVKDPEPVKVDDPELMKRELRSFARIHELSPAVLDEVGA